MDISDAMDPSNAVDPSNAMDPSDAGDARPDVVVIGAGPGGLATAAELGRRGLSAVVVDKADAVGSAWRQHYERLHLHTIRWNSHLPGLKIPRSYGRWVARADVVRYLESYATHHRLNVALGVQADRIERDGAGAGHDGEWVVRSPQGDRRASTVVVATGYNHTPDIPPWPGLDTFAGEVRHSTAYRNAAPYAGRDVLVVGTGNTGAEIAVDLVEGGAARVRLAVRTVPTFVRREVGPMLDNSGAGRVLRRLPVKLVDRIIATTSRLRTPDLAAHGLPRPGPGVYTRLLADGTVPIIDVGLIKFIQSGQVEAVAAVSGFDDGLVRLSDGTAIAPDAVIAATGFKQGLDELVGHLGLLDDRGRPIVRGAQTHPHGPDLYFTGYTNPISGMFHELNRDARRIAQAVAKRAGVRA
jgi:cation diffusion facilitator CzcD-associated flavoprotein CzcO